jgi:hypothetical protein
MSKSRNAPCKVCQQYWIRIRGGGIPDFSEVCPACRQQHKRLLGRNRARRFRAKKGNAPNGQAERGNSLNEVDIRIDVPTQAVNTNSLNRFSQGREGWAKPPLAIAGIPLPLLPTLDNLRIDLIAMTAIIRAENAAIFAKTPDPVVTGVTKGKNNA